MHELSPEKFAEFLRDTVLEDISICSVSAERFVDTLPQEFTMQYGDASELKVSDHCRAVIHATYGVRLADASNDEAAAVMEVTLRAVYGVPEEMTEAIFEQFKKVTLRIHTVSFAREWIRDMSSRMGLQPILLPLALAHPAAVRNTKKKPTKKAS